MDFTSKLKIFCNRFKKTRAFLLPTQNVFTMFLVPFAFEPEWWAFVTEAHGEQGQGFDSPTTNWKLDFFIWTMQPKYYKILTTVTNALVYTRTSILDPVKLIWRIWSKSNKTSLNLLFKHSNLTCMIWAVSLIRAQIWTFLRLLLQPKPFLD